MPVKIIAEIGINHNGSLSIAKKLIDVASFSGCDYVKFQKRTPDLCVPEDQKNVIKKTLWGDMTYLDYKKKIEFNENEYEEIDGYCRQKNMNWFASVWDVASCDFMKRFTSIAKIPSALITNHDLCIYARNNFDQLMISTGMSTEQEIDDCVSVCNPDVIFHTNSTYPCPENQLNLNYISHLKHKHPNKMVGYSSHEFGIITTIATTMLGVSHIEKHICIDRTMWGSDQMASVEPQGLIKLVRGVRNVESAMGSGEDRVVYSGEIEKRKSLRGH